MKKHPVLPLVLDRQNPLLPNINCAVVSLVTGVASQIAQGQTQPAPSEPALSAVVVIGEKDTGYSAKRTTTFTKTDTPLKEIPASITIVPEQLMKDMGMQNMSDVIRYVPGATAHQGEGNRDQIILRGISTTADFYIDGVRDDAQVFRDLYNLDRVEVLKGAGGMMFGRGAAGGIVNRVTKKPVFGHHGNASLTLGTHQQVRGTVDVGDRLNESAAWRLNAVAEDSNSFRDGVGMQRYAVNPTVSFALGGQTLLTLGYEHLWDYRTADRGIPAQNGRPFNTDPSTFFGNSGQSQARSVVDGAYAILDHDFGGGVQLKNTFRVTHYDKYYQNVYPDNANASSVDAAGNMRLAAYNNANQRTNIFNQTDVITKVTAGSMEHTLLAGLELGHQDSTNKRNTGFFGPAPADVLITVPASVPFAVATRFQPNGTDADNNVEADVAAVYVQDQLSINNEWKVLGGLRYDYFKTQFDDRRTTTTATDLARTDNGLSPRLGVIWLPNTVSSYYVNYSYSFLPSGEQLSLAPNTADLAPEKAKNFEIGGRWDLMPALSLHAAIFRLDRDDVRSPDPLNPGFFVKTGQQRTQGVELGVQGEVTRAWQVFAGYAYLDGKITQTTSAAVAGSRLQLVPQNMFSWWNQVDVGNGWGFGLGIVYQDESFTSLDNRVTLPAFTRFDGAIYYAFANGRARLTMNVENLFDKKYFPTADGNNNISPGAPINGRLTLSALF